MSKFAFVGVTATALDFLLFNFIAHVLYLRPFGLSEAMFAQLCSGLICVPFTYILNKKFTFQSEKGGASTVLKYFGVSYFNAWILQTCVIVFVVFILSGLNLAALFGFAGNKILINNLAKCAGIACGMVSNFTFYHFIFKEKEPVLYE